jgi:hypothetical protein
LTNILGASHLTLSGWLIIDGGGNRPAFDAAIAAEANLCLLPFRASEEDLDTVADDMRRLPNAMAWPTAWPTKYVCRMGRALLRRGFGEGVPDAGNQYSYSVRQLGF